MTPADGEPQEFIAGDSFVIPKGFHGTWQTLGHYREIIVIERQAYEETYGVPAD